MNNLQLRHRRTKLLAELQRLDPEAAATFCQMIAALAQINIRDPAGDCAALETEIYVAKQLKQR